MDDIFDGLNLDEDSLFVPPAQPEPEPKAKGVDLETQTEAQKELIAALNDGDLEGVFDLPEEDIKRKGLRDLVMTALEARGGVNYLQNLQDKDFVKLLTSVIPAELKITAEIKPHEDFLKILAQSKDIKEADAKDITNFKQEFNV